MTATQPLAEPFLRVENLDVVFPNGTKALAAVDLTVAPGEFVALVGPSGCGKSTLLRVIAGLLAPSAGAAKLSGRECGQQRREKQDISFVFQSPTLLPWRTVEKNVRLPLELQRRLQPDSRERVEQLLQLVGLQDFRRAFPHQLSGGMQMRASLARALVTKPETLLLDEPFGALDDMTRQRLNEELLALWQRDRFTAIFVTHNVSEAAFLSDRVVVMSARPGRVLREHRVPFAHPREPALRTSPEFARFCGEITASLAEAFA